MVIRVLCSRAAGKAAGRGATRLVGASKRLECLSSTLNLALLLQGGVKIGNFGQLRFPKLAGRFPSGAGPHPSKAPLGGRGPGERNRPGAGFLPESG